MVKHIPHVCESWAQSPRAACAGEACRVLQSYLISFVWSSAVFNPDSCICAQGSLTAKFCGTIQGAEDPYRTIEVASRASLLTHCIISPAPD